MEKLNQTISAEIQDNNKSKITPPPPVDITTIKRPAHKRNIWVDLFRYFLAFLVICIHFDNPLWRSNLLPMLRLSVAFFFVLAGFYAYYPDEKVNLQKSKSAIGRNLQYFGISVGIYIILNIIFLFINTPKDGSAFAAYFLSFFNNDTLHNLIVKNIIPGNFPYTYALWFIVALTEVSIFHYLMVKFKKTKYYPFIAGMGIMVYMFVAYYSRYVSNIAIPAENLSNALFFGIPCFAIGYILKKRLTQLETRRQFKLKWLFLWGMLAMLFWGLTIIEAKYIGILAYYFSSILASVAFLVLFDYIDHIKWSKLENLQNTLSQFFYRWIGAGGAFYIYVLHVAVGNILLKYVRNIRFLTIVIFLISFLIYEIAYLSIKLIKYLYIKKEK